MDATSPLLSIAEAARVAGLKPSHAQALVRHSRIVMLGQPRQKAGTPARASVIDAIRLAVLSRLKDAGLSDGQALYVLDLAFDPLVGALFAPGIPVPACMVLPRIDGRAVHVVPDPDGDWPDVYSTRSDVPGPTYASLVHTFRFGPIARATIERINHHATKDHA